MITQSGCKFCGQMSMTTAETEEEALKQATMACNCNEATAYQEVHMRAEDARIKTVDMCNKNAVPEEVITLAEIIINTMISGTIEKVQCNLTDGKKLTIVRKGRGITSKCKSEKEDQVNA